MTRTLWLAALLASATLLGAEDERFPTLKIGAEVYTNVTVTSVTATHVYFTHNRGLGNAKLKELDPSLQKMFHYDATLGAAAEMERSQANAAYRQGLTSAAAPSHPGPTPQVTSGQRAPDPGGGIPPHEISAKSFLNQYAPGLKVEKWLTPEPDTEGKFILVDFWATWCGPCRRSIPHLNTLYGMFKKRLVVIGLSDQTEFEVRQMTNPSMTYPVGIDTQQRMSSILQVRGIPHAILIDPKGIVRFEGHPGYLNSQNLASLLDKYGQ